MGSKGNVHHLFKSLQNTAGWLHLVFSSVVKPIGVLAKFWVYFLIADCQSRYFTV